MSDAVICKDSRGCIHKSCEHKRGHAPKTIYGDAMPIKMLPCTKEIYCSILGEFCHCVSIDSAAGRRGGDR